MQIVFHEELEDKGERNRIDRRCPENASERLFPVHILPAARVEESDRICREILHDQYDDLDRERGVKVGRFSVDDKRNTAEDKSDQGNPDVAAVIEHHRVAEGIPHADVLLAQFTDDLGCQIVDQHQGDCEQEDLKDRFRQYGRIDLIERKCRDEHIQIDFAERLNVQLEMAAEQIADADDQQDRCDVMRENIQKDLRNDPSFPAARYSITVPAGI